MKGLLSFGFPLFLKVIIPGIVGAFFLNPLIASILIKLELDVGFSGKSLSKIGLFFAGLALFIGFMLYFLDHYIYRIFEGYKFWPECIRKYRTRKLDEKVKNRFVKYQSAEDEIDRKILMEWLMRFPLKEGAKEAETEAILPTQMGNIISSYESYPYSRYGLNAIFYWPRLWLSLDNETRKEMDKIWAEADCMTYISFVLVCSAIFGFLAFLFDYFNIITLILGPIGKPIDSLAIGKMSFTPSFFLGLGIISLAFSSLFYRLSLPLHVKNGSYFQSLFDLHRDKLEKMQLTVTKKLLDKGWVETWAYLKYGLKECIKCGKYFPSHKKKCPHCEKP